MHAKNLQKDKGLNVQLDGFFGGEKGPLSRAGTLEREGGGHQYI